MRTQSQQSAVIEAKTAVSTLVETSSSTSSQSSSPSSSSTSASDGAVIAALLEHFSIREFNIEITGDGAESPSFTITLSGDASSGAWSDRKSL